MALIYLFRAERYGMSIYELSTRPAEFTVEPSHYPNQIDITKAPLAFGDRAVPRLVNL